MHSHWNSIPRLDKGRRIASTLEKTRHALGAEKKTWAEVLGVSERDYELVRKGAKPVSIAALEAMARYLNVSLEAFSNNEVDTSALAARFRGEKDYLRERYSTGALSRRWSSINILDYIENFFSWQLRALALRHLQVSEAVFGSPDGKISLQFPLDLYDFLHRQGVGDSHFFSIGANSVITYLDSPLGHELRKSREIGELFEIFCAHVGTYLEQNHHYLIERLDNESCVIVCFPTSDVRDALGVNAPGSPRLCSTKAGVMAALPAYLGLTFADVEEITCIHRGDDACRFEADFTRAAAMKLLPSGQA
jgi:hypothetical protein